MPIWSPNFARTPIVLLAVTEALVLFLSVLIGQSLMSGILNLGDTNPDALTAKAAAMSGVMTVCLIAMGLYQFHQRVLFHEVFARILVAVGLGSVVLAAGYYLFPTIEVEPRVAVVSIAFALLFITAVRYMFVTHVDENIFRRRTIIYGAGERATTISQLRRKADRRGFRIIATIPAEGDIGLDQSKTLRMDVENLTEFALSEKADEIVVAMDDRRGNLPVRELLDSKLLGVDVIDIMEFMERETGKIRLDLVNPGWLIFSPGFRVNKMRKFVKRATDILFTSLALVIALPVMLGVALAIKIMDGWSLPVFYKQKRVGLHGKTFNVLKFRSMRPDAEKGGAVQWATENDPRVTKIGGFLRTYRLDELPQIINVLSGNMSIVGPRPERPKFVKELAERIPYYLERHTVKPGVTGWAQLKYSYGASVEDSKEKLQYDLYYVKNHSFLLDLMIILQTVEVVLWGKGAR